MKNIFLLLVATACLFATSCGNNTPKAKIHLLTGQDIYVQNWAADCNITGDTVHVLKEGNDDWKEVRANNRFKRDTTITCYKLNKNNDTSAFIAQYRTGIVIATTKQ